MELEVTWGKAFSIWWAWSWRIISISIALVIFVGLLAPVFSRVTDDTTSEVDNIIIMATSIIAYIPLIPLSILTLQHTFNKVNFKNFRILCADKAVTDGYEIKLSFLETTSFLWAATWRPLLLTVALSLIVNFLFTSLGYNLQENNLYSFISFIEFSCSVFIYIMFFKNALAKKDFKSFKIILLEK